MISTEKVNGYIKTILILSGKLNYIIIYFSLILYYMVICTFLIDQESHSNIKNYNDIVTLPTQNILGFEVSKLFSNLKCSEDHKKDYYLSLIHI